MSKPPVVSSIWLPVDPHRAIDQFLDPAALRAWWGAADALLQARPGGLWTVGWERTSHGYAYVMTAIVSRYVPGSELELNPLVYLHPEHRMLGPMLLAITAHPEANGSRLTARQEGYQSGGGWAWYHEAVTHGWPAALSMLQRHCERGGG